MKGVARAGFLGHNARPFACEKLYKVRKPSSFPADLLLTAVGSSVVAVDGAGGVSVDAVGAAGDASPMVVANRPASDAVALPPHA